MSAESGQNRAPPLYAVAAEFDTAGALLAGVRGIRNGNFGRIDAYSPVPVPGMSQAIGLRRSSMSLAATGAVILGFLACMGLCLYATAIDYPFNIGGRPRLSWPAFVVPSASAALMAGALTVYLLMLFLNRLPRLNHPVFNIEAFTRVTQDRYFLVVEAADGPIDPEAVEAAFAALPERPLAVTRVVR